MDNQNQNQNQNQNPNPNPQPKKKKGKGCLIAVVVVVVILIIAGIYGSGNKKKDQGQTSQTTTEQKQEPKQEAIKVTAEKVSKEFEANELKGKELYGDKLAEITGVVQSIDEIGGKKFVVLDGDKSDPANIVSIQCFFSDENAKGLSELKKGQKVTIIGTVEGKTLNVLVKDCKLK